MEEIRLSILLADDNPANQKVLGYMLKRLGHKVTIVADGKAAVEACGQTRFDLVFMDMMMPEMDGITATRAIRTSETGLRRTPVIAVTASVEREDERKCVDAGMDAFLSKPFTLPQIRDLVGRFSQSRFNGAHAGGLDSGRLRTFIDTMGDGDVVFTMEILDDLMEEGNRTRSDLQQALDEMMPDRVRHVAHSLKSAASVVGALGLASICDRMERAAFQSDLSQVMLLMSPFEGALNEVSRDVEEFRRSNATLLTS